MLPLLACLLASCLLDRCRMFTPGGIASLTSRASTVPYSMECPDLRHAAALRGSSLLCASPRFGPGPGTRLCLYFRRHHPFSLSLLFLLMDCCRLAVILCCLPPPTPRAPPPRAVKGTVHRHVSAGSAPRRRHQTSSSYRHHSSSSSPLSPQHPSQARSFSSFFVFLVSFLPEFVTTPHPSFPDRQSPPSSDDASLLAYFAPFDQCCGRLQRDSDPRQC